MQTTQQLHPHYQHQHWEVIGEGVSEGEDCREVEREGEDEGEGEGEGGEHQSELEVTYTELCFWSACKLIPR